MEQLETICISKLRVLRNIVFTEADFKCRSCTDYSQECFRPYSPSTQINIRQGVVAYNLQNGK
jgi:hypothetical protein